MINQSQFNPAQILQMARQGGNPQQLMMQLARQNPAIRQAMQMMNGRTPGQIRDMVYQMAQQRGIDLDKMAQQWGVKLPK